MHVDFATDVAKYMEMAKMYPNCPKANECGPAWVVTMSWNTSPCS